MTEPVAAALAHDIGIYQEKERKEILVFDLGGGTFDVSLLSLQKTDMGPIFVVKTIEGDSHLGGEDFDNNLVQHVMQAQLADVQWEQGERGRRDMNEFMCQLRSKCEKAKRTLGTEDSVSITLSHLGKDYETREVTLTREVFERINKHLFERCLAIVKSVADTAAAAGTPVGSVIATGGSSQIPYLRERLASIINDAQSHPSASSPSSSSSSSSFPKGTLLKYKDDPDTAVALGACNFAASLWRPYEPTSPKLILIETCPYNIGIAVKGAGGGGGASKASRTTMDIFFERGSTIPATKTFSYTTVYDRQRFAQIAVYEGMDRNYPSANHRLGNFVLEVSEPMPAGQPKIDVKVSLDLDGILTVTAMEKSSKASLEIRACKTTLSAREVRFKKLTSDKDELIDEVDCLQSTLSDKIATLSGKNLEAHIIKAIKKWRNDKDSMEALTELNELCQAEAELQPIQPAIKLLLKQTKYLHSVRSELQELVSLGSGNQALELHYHTIFLVDRSHSMRKKDSCFLDGKVATRFDSVFECILKYLDDRSFTDDTFTMLLFNNKVRTVFKRLKYSPRLEDKIRDIRKKYPPHSTTSFRVAIDKIANVVTQAPEENTVVIMLSDGHDPDFMDACQTLSDLVKNRTTPPVFHAIRFGNSKTTAEALEKLAEAGNGKFSTSKDGIALNECFGEIRRAIEKKINVWDDSTPTNTLGIAPSELSNLLEAEKEKNNKKKTNANPNKMGESGGDSPAVSASREEPPPSSQGAEEGTYSSSPSSDASSSLQEEDQETYLSTRSLLRRLFTPPVRYSGRKHLKDKNDFQRCFLASYRSLMRPKELLDAFIESYTNVKEESKKKERQEHLLTVLDMWTKSYPEDFKGLREPLFEFLDSHCQSSDYKATISSSLEATTRAHFGIQDSTSGSTTSLLDNSPSMLASQITFLMMRSFVEIKEYELMDQAWSSPLRNRTNKAMAMIKLAEKLSWWVVERILSASSLNERMRTLAHLVRVAQELQNLCNYQGMVAVLSGLGHAPIARLEGTKAQFTKEYRQDKRNYFAMMRAVQQHKTAFKNPHKQSCVPWLEPYLAEIVQLEEDSPERDEQGKRINWQRKEQVYKAASSALAHQQVTVEALLHWKDYAALTVLFGGFPHRTEEHLMALSKSLE
ncbi:Hsp70 ATPase ssa1 [Balamuthia mandrillaris]